MLSFAGFETVIVATLCPGECSLVVHMISAFALSFAESPALAYALSVGFRRCSLSCRSLRGAEVIGKEKEARDMPLDSRGTIPEIWNCLEPFLVNLPDAQLIAPLLDALKHPKLYDRSQWDISSNLVSNTQWFRTGV